MTKIIFTSTHSYIFTFYHLHFFWNINLVFFSVLVGCWFQVTSPVMDKRDFLLLRHATKKKQFASSLNYIFMKLFFFSLAHVWSIFFREELWQIWKCRDMARLVLELLIYSAKIKTCHFQNQSLANFPISCPCRKKARYSKSSRKDSKDQSYLRIVRENSSPIKNNLVLCLRLC